MSRLQIKMSNQTKGDEMQSNGNGHQSIACKCFPLFSVLHDCAGHNAYGTCFVLVPLLFDWFHIISSVLLCLAAMEEI